MFQFISQLIDYACSSFSTLWSAISMIILLLNKVYQLKWQKITSYAFYNLLSLLISSKVKLYSLAISYFFLWLVIHRHFQPQTLYDCFPLNLPVLCLDICLKTIWRFSSSFSISCFISVSWVFLSLIWTFSSPFWKLSSSRRDFTSCVWKKKKLTPPVTVNENYFKISSVIYCFIS